MNENKNWNENLHMKNTREKPGIYSNVLCFVNYLQVTSKLELNTKLTTSIS